MCYNKFIRENIKVFFLRSRRLILELLDVLDENGIKTGEILSRPEVHKRGLWHRIIVVAIIDGQNRILMQQRSANKDKNPNMWDLSVTGHISAGQDSLSAAYREINEEVSVDLGYKVDIKDFRYMFSYRKQHKVNEDHFDRQYYDFFILRKPKIDIAKMKYQESEVQKLKLVSVPELQEMIENKVIVERDETYKALFEYLFRC